MIATGLVDKLKLIPIHRPLNVFGVTYSFHSPCGDIDDPDHEPLVVFHMVIDSSFTVRHGAIVVKVLNRDSLWRFGKVNYLKLDVFGRASNMLP